MSKYPTEKRRCLYCREEFEVPIIRSEIVCPTCRPLSEEERCARAERAGAPMTKPLTRTKQTKTTTETYMNPNPIQFHVTRVEQETERPFVFAVETPPMELTPIAVSADTTFRLVQKTMTHQETVELVNQLLGALQMETLEKYVEYRQVAALLALDIEQAHGVLEIHIEEGDVPEADDEDDIRCNLAWIIKDLKEKRDEAVNDWKARNDRFVGLAQLFNLPVMVVDE